MQRVWSTNKVHIFKDTTNYHANTFGFYAPVGNSLLELMENSKAKSVYSFLDVIKANNQANSIVVVLGPFVPIELKRPKRKPQSLAYTYFLHHTVLILTQLSSVGDA